MSSFYYWYVLIFVMLFSLLAMSFIAKCLRFNLDRINATISAVILWFFMAFRSMFVGTDTKQYVYIFEQIESLKFSELFSTRLYFYGGRYLFGLSNFPKGYLIFNKLLTYISSNGQTITIACTTLIFAFMIRLLKKRSSYPMLSLWLFYTLGIYQTDMNVMRNAVIVFWCYLCFDLVEKQRLVLYIFCVLLASSFHLSALLFIPFYWIINRVDFTPKLIRRLLLTAIVFGVLLSFMRPVLASVLPSVFAQYFDDNSEKLEGLLVGALHLGLVFGIFFISAKRNWRYMADVDRVGIWMLLAETFFFALGIGMRSSLRMAALFGPYIIILIPNLIDKSSKNGNKNVVLLIIIVLTGLQYLLRIRINNIGGSMPYSFFWA